MADFRTAIRVGVDWDDDGFICYEAVPTDPLNNLIPTPITWANLTVADRFSGTLSFIKSRTLYGLHIANYICSSSSNDGIVFGADASPSTEIPVSASTTYVATHWIRGIANYAGVNFNTRMRDQDDNVINNSGSYTITADWTKVQWEFTTGSGDTAVQFFAAKSADASLSEFQVTGIMITLGTTQPAGFNAGHATNGYDNVTGDVRNAKWRLGIPDRDLLMSSEGEATINLDNLTQLYSPEKSTSALFDFLLSERMITIEVADSIIGTFTNVWTGWTEKFSPATGRNRSEQCTLKCNQGVFLLIEAKFKSAIQQNIDSGAAVQQIIDDSDWVSAHDPSGFLGSKYGIIEVGKDTYPVVGDDWNSDDSIYDALAEIIDTEQGLLWLTESGQLEFRNRHYVLLKQRGAADFTLNASSDFFDAEYEYGQQIFNSAKFTFYPKTLEADFTAWENRGAILINVDETVVINASFEYEESTSINMLALDGTHLIVDFNDATNYAATTTLVTVLKNDEAELTITNDGSTSRQYRITLKGTAVRSFGGQIIESADQTSIDKHKLHRITKTFKLLEGAEETLGLAQFYIARYKTPFGEFKTLALHDRDSTYFSRMLGLTVGTTVDLTDTRTGTTLVRHLITGHSGTWVQGDFVMVYDAMHIIRFDAFILDHSELDSNDRLGY